MSHFAFLRSEWPAILVDAQKAEQFALGDPRASCFYARRSLELVVEWLYSHDNSLRAPYESSLSARLHEKTFRDLVGQTLLTKAKYIKDVGNLAVHSLKPVSTNDATNAVREFFHVAYWLARTYGRSERPPPDLKFDAAKLPRTMVVAQTSIAVLQHKAKEAAESDKKLAEAQRHNAVLDAQLAQLRAELEEVKRRNEAEPDRHDYSETETRDAFIDLLLKEAGWPLNKPEDREYPVSGMPNQQEQGFVDYVLWGDNGLPVGLVEAKRTKRDPRVGQRQAELYADCLEKQFNQRPIIFYSNGYKHWIWDDQFYPPREVQGFLTKDELQLLIQRRATRKSLATTPISKDIVNRHYQERAIRRIGEAFEKDHDRKTLLVMATGAGKTRTVIALVDVLLRANWAKRVLFLADRVALVNQAVKAFKTHLPSAAPVNLVTEKSTDGRAYVSTYPTMMGLIDEMDDGKRRFGPGYFDLIVIDEAHRSVYQKYGAIFEYFDSLLVGLTATPKDEIDRNTYRLFELENGVPTDAYGLEDAVRDGFLVPPKAVSVPLRFQREGIRYDDLSEDEKTAWDALEWSEDGEVPDLVNAEAVNRWLFNKDTVDKVLEHVMTREVLVAGGDRLGKTIIFAKNHQHALFIQERFDANYPEHKGVFARVIDFKTEYAQTLIDDFSAAEKAPHIAISVDMLDTGIDVPEVVNLVFFKMVRSKTKFWQMIGRGTRLRPDLFGPGDDKKLFYVFDYCQNLEFFRQNLPATEGSANASLGKRLFQRRLELIAELDRQKEGDGEGAQLRKDTAERLWSEVAGMTIENFIVRPHRKVVEQFAEASAWEKLSAEDQAVLAAQVAGLPSGFVDDDEEAKRFDLLILRLQLAVLRNEKSFTRLQKEVRDIASALEEQADIPLVRKELELIQEVQTDGYWQDITVAMLETVRYRLRGLVKWIEKTERKRLYTDFADEMGEAVEVELPGLGSEVDFERFRAKVRQFLKSHENHIAIHKLRRNEALTATDLAELERMLSEAGPEAKTWLPRAKEQGLGLFVRSLVGLERDAAKKALGAFLDGKKLTANQIEFVDLVINYLTENGAMDPSRLYESPFTDKHPLGIEGVFPANDVPEFLKALERIQSAAQA